MSTNLPNTKKDEGRLRIKRPEEESWYHRQLSLTWSWTNWSQSCFNFWQIFVKRYHFSYTFSFEYHCCYLMDFDMKIYLLFIILRYVIIRTTLDAGKKDPCLGIVLGETSPKHFLKEDTCASCDLMICTSSTSILVTYTQNIPGKTLLHIS